MINFPGNNELSLHLLEIDEIVMNGYFEVFMKISPEQKLLVAIHSEEVFWGGIIRQEMPKCCSGVIDLYKTRVWFKEILVGGKLFVLLEPNCPVCGKRVAARYSVIN